MKINLLPPLLANQIAAGEVVERPASVVKELIENSLDAEGTVLEIRLKDGGKKLIQIRDNGEGIDKEDLVLAISQHATSKIKELEDLHAIHSLGFRGEALASISSVSQLTLHSKTKSAELAWQIAVEGRELKPLITPSSHPNGTMVVVKDLFFNTPARKKFLRTNQTELAHIDEIIKRIALSRFDVALTVFNDEVLFRQYPAATTAFQKEKRVIKIFGQQFMQQAHFLDISATSLRLWGWLGSAAFSRQQSDLQYFYVNGRVIKDRILSHAVRQAFEDKLPIGRYPAYVLYLEMDPREVDVNVHPTKHEVRFHESRLVHDFIVSSLRKGLVQETVIKNKQPDLSNFIKEKENFSSSKRENYVAQASQKYGIFVSQAMNSIEETEVVLKEENNTTNQSTLRLVGVAHNKLAIYEIIDGLLMVPVASIYQHFLYTDWTQQWQSKGYLDQQLLLIPRQVQLLAEQVDFFVEHTEEFKKSGLEYNALGPEKLILRSVPKGLYHLELSQLFVQLQKIKFNTDFFAEEIDPLFIALAQNGEVEEKKKIHWLLEVDETLLNALSPLFVSVV